MKKLVSVLCILCLILTSFACTLADGVEIDILATGDVHIRKDPNLEGEDMGVLKKGDTKPFGYEVSVDDRGVAWYLAGMDDEWGWISSRYSTLTDGAVEGLEYDAELNGTELTMLSGDTLAVDPAKGIGAVNVEEGDTVQALGYSVVVGEEDTWYLVDLDGETGWVNGLNVAFPDAE